MAGYKSFLPITVGGVVPADIGPVVAHTPGKAVAAGADRDRFYCLPDRTLAGTEAGNPPDRVDRKAAMMVVEIVKADSRVVVVVVRADNRAVVERQQACHAS